VESDLLLFFECSEEVMEERLLKRSETSGRPDDNVETIKKRFATFVEKTLPVINHYEELHKVKKVSFLFYVCVEHWFCFVYPVNKSELYNNSVTGNNSKFQFDLDIHV